MAMCINPAPRPPVIRSLVLRNIKCSVIGWGRDCDAHPSTPPIKLRKWAGQGRPGSHLSAANWQGVLCEFHTSCKFHPIHANRCRCVCYENQWNLQNQITWVCSSCTKSHAVPLHRIVRRGGEGKVRTKTTVWGIQQISSLQIPNDENTSHLQTDGLIVQLFHGDILQSHSRGRCLALLSHAQYKDMTEVAHICVWLQILNFPLHCSVIPHTVYTHHCRTWAVLLYKLEGSLNVEAFVWFYISAEVYAPSDRPRCPIGHKTPQRGDSLNNHN